MKAQFAALALLAALPGAACAEQAPAAAEDQAADTPMQLSPDDAAAAFIAAGFHRDGDGWRACDDPGTPSYTPGAIESVQDLNADGLPEAVLAEGSGYCHGMAGVGYYLVSKQADGGWRLMNSGTGMALFLQTTGADGWPDLQVGGPGFCFAVLRWDGSSYAFHRNEYEGKPCTP